MLAIGFAVGSFTYSQVAIVPALPILRRDLHTTTAWATWTVTAYLLVAAVAMPISGKLGDQFGKKRVFVMSQAFFLLGLLGACAATTIGQLIACRLVQGLGGGVVPLSFAIARDELPKERIGVGIGIISMMYALGTTLSFAASGLLVDHFGWRAIFAVGAIAVGIAVALAVMVIPHSPAKTWSRVDVLGATVLGASLVCVLLALTQGVPWGWLSLRTDSLFAAGIASFAGWVSLERRTAFPMVDVKMLAKRALLVTNVATVAMGSVMYASQILVASFVEAPRGMPVAVGSRINYGFGASAAIAGLYLVPGTILGALTASLVGLASRRHDPKWALAGTLLVGAGGMLSFALWHTRPWEVLLAGLAIGLGPAATQAGIAGLITRAVEPDQTGTALGMNAVMRVVGNVIGTQCVAAILASVTIAHTAIAAEEAFVACGAMLAGLAVSAAVGILFVGHEHQQRA